MVHRLSRCSSVRADVVVISDDVYNGTGPSNLLVVEIDGVFDAIQQLDNSILQLKGRAVLDEDDK